MFWAKGNLKAHGLQLVLRISLVLNEETGER